MKSAVLRRQPGGRVRTLGLVIPVVLAALLLGCPPAGGGADAAAAGEPDAGGAPHMPDAGAAADGRSGHDGRRWDHEQPDASDPYGPPDSQDACVEQGEVCTPGGAACCAGVCREYPMHDGSRCLADEEPPAPAWCAPQPAAPRSPLASDAFARFEAQRAEGCRLLRVETDDDGDGTVDDVAYLPPPDGELPLAFAYAWEAPNFPGSTFQNLFTATVRVGAADDGAGGLHMTVEARSSGSTAQQRLERTFDAAGHLLREEHWWNDALWYELDLSWEGDHLVGATYVDRINGGERPGPLAWTFVWTWDDRGRLAQGEVRGGRELDAVATVDWTYDEAGRPVRAERRTHGATWLVQAWSYDAEGRLVSRRTERAGGGRGPDQPLDDMRPGQLDGHGVAGTWDDALPRDAGACTRLPTAVAHGYPGAEVVYDLGWPADARPSGIGFDYGYNGYAYNYGETAWFGHGGVAGGSDALGRGEDTWSEVTYDPRGRAVREVIEGPIDGVASLRVERVRRYVGDRLVEDVRTVGDGPDARSSTLRFAYDADGRILTRDYFVGDTLLAEHTWTWDRWGGIASHSIAHHGWDYGAFVGQEWSWEPLSPEVGEVEGPPPLRWLHEHIRSEDGRHVVMQKSGPLGDGATVYGEEERDAAGNLVSRWSYGSREFYAYDDAGRLTLQGWDFDGDGELDRATRRVLDAGDRLILLESYDTSQGTHAIERYFYTCL